MSTPKKQSEAVKAAAVPAAPATPVVTPAAPAATASAPAPKPQSVAASPVTAPTSPWANTPASVQRVFTDMLNALTSLPGMQGYHGAGCMCGWCVHIQLAIVDAKKICTE